MRKMRIFILGKEGSDTYAMTQAAEEALHRTKIPYTLRKIDDEMQIMMYGVSLLPTLVTDDIVRIIGRVPSVEEVEHILNSILEYEEKHGHKL